MAGTSPAMTPEKWLNMTGSRSSDTEAVASAPTPLSGIGVITFMESGAHFLYSTSPDITMGSDLGSLNGVQRRVLPCVSVATTR
jgi:hypothetical protein